MRLAFPTTDLWFVAWFALVPLFWSLRDCSGKAAFYRGWAFGAVFFYGICFFLNTLAVYVPIVVVGIALLLCGLGYKIAAVPFHMWTPDAYEGAPTPVTAFMAAGVKAAAFAALLRVLTTAFGLDALKDGSTGWVSILQVLAVITMTLGNVAALRQENVKRLLGYSAISHAGFLLVGVVAVGVTGKVAQPSVLYCRLCGATRSSRARIVVWIKWLTLICWLTKP